MYNLERGLLLQKNAKRIKDYKQAIVKAQADDIVLTDKISGVSVAVIKTPYIESIGTKANSMVKWLLRGRRTKHWSATLLYFESNVAAQKITFTRHSL